MTHHSEPGLTAERRRWSRVASSVAGHASPLAESCYCVLQGEHRCHPERQRGIWVASSGAWTWVLARYAERVVSRPSPVVRRPEGAPDHFKSHADRRPLATSEPIRSFPRVQRHPQCHRPVRIHRSRLVRNPAPIRIFFDSQLSSRWNTNPRRSSFPNISGSRHRANLRDHRHCLTRNGLVTSATAARPEGAYTYAPAVQP
jgi:hypothetical protein